MSELVLSVLLWSAVTVCLYCVANRLHRQWPRRWLMPVLTAPILVALVLLVFRVDYPQYIQGTRWLVLMLGPAMVAFAVPIYEQRVLIRTHWPVLLLGMLAGSVTALLSSWAMAMLLSLDDTLMRSLLPRSISTAFAMEVAETIGGIPELTAVFVVLTGVVGAIMGDLMLSRGRPKSVLARGAMFGMGAHAIGTAQAQQVGRSEGAIAGLVMVLVGVLNVLAAPLIENLLRVAG